METNEKQKKSGSYIDTSPEALGNAIKISGIPSWIAVITAFIMIIGGITWGIAGKIPQNVQGIGIVLPKEGLMEVISIGQGQVSEFNAWTGKTVRKDEIVAKLSNETLTQQYDITKKELNDSKIWHEKRISFYKNSLGKLRHESQEEIRLTSEKIQYLSEYLSFLKVHLQGLEKLKSHGAATPIDAEQVRNSRNSIQASISESKINLARIETNLTTKESEAEFDLMQCEERVHALERKSESIEEQIKLYSNVKSLFEGVVIECSTKSGEWVGTGNPVAILRPLDAKYHAILFIPANVAKKISKGNIVHIYPSTINKEEYGGIVGTVENITDYPSTDMFLLKRLRNSRLVAMLNELGAVFCVTVEFKQQTSGKLIWTASSGPSDFNLTVGLQCEAKVETGYKRPIDLLIPQISNRLGMKPL
ncbi:MAG: NHLP bacteriocin system secretion protein [Desulfobacterales bacterium]|nr:NHLP bacteriocin system secretion protein [Desulfobacterales bacterium]